MRNKKRLEKKVIIAVRDYINTYISELVNNTNTGEMEGLTQKNDVDINNQLDTIEDLERQMRDMDETITGLKKQLEVLIKKYAKMVVKKHKRKRVCQRFSGFRFTLLLLKKQLNKDYENK